MAKTTKKQTKTGVKNMPTEGVVKKRKLPSLKESRFSRNQLLVFVLIFGALGAWLIWRSFAASTGTAYNITSSLVDNGTISGKVTWTVTVTPQPYEVDFYVDGVKSSHIENYAPFQYNGDPNGVLDTTTLSNGKHTLKEVAIFDNGGNTTINPAGYLQNGAVISASHVVNVSNTTSTGTTGGTTGGSTGSTGGTTSGSGGTTTGTYVAGLTSGDSTYDNAIAYSQPANRPSFAYKRHILVYNSSQLLNAINGIQAGDWIENAQAGGFVVSGEITLTQALSSKAVVDLKTGADAVRFTAGGSQYDNNNTPAFYVKGASNMAFYGGNFTNGRIYMGPSTNMTFWNFYIHDVAGDGFDMFPFNSGTITGADIQGEIVNWGVNCKNLDPHAEKCTGIHGMNISDSTGNVTSSRVAVNVHDGNSGAAIELGSESNVASNLTFYLKADHLNMAAQTQSAGNGFMLWGSKPFSNVTVQYMNVTNAQGRAVETNGVESGASFSGFKVVTGRASNDELNTRLTKVNWSTVANPTYQDVSPKP